MIQTYEERYNQAMLDLQTAQAHVSRLTIDNDARTEKYIEIVKERDNLLEHKNRSIRLAGDKMALRKEINDLQEKYNALQTQKETVINNKHTHYDFAWTAFWVSAMTVVSVITIWG